MGENASGKKAYLYFQWLNHASSDRYELKE